MKICWILSLLITLIAAFEVDAQSRMTTGFPDLPRDAAKVAERGLACIHFSGELNGTGDERDRWVTDQMRKLRCDRVEKDLQRMKNKYGNKPEILKILSEATYI